MKKSCIIITGIFLLFTTCKQKVVNDQKEAFISVLSIIRGQVKHVDTSIYRIIKVTYKDSTYGDTEYIKRENFSQYAGDFLEIPDIADKKHQSEYTEEKLYDESLNRVIITYRPKNPDKADIQRQELVIIPDPFGGESKIKNIIIERGFSNRDSSVQKIMLWQVDQSFQVTNIIQKNGQPEMTNTFKVMWNED